MRRSTAARRAYTWISAFIDPFRTVRAIRAIPSFARDYLAYRRSPDAEPLALGDMVPALHERLQTHEVDAHYFYVNAWAARRVVADRPTLHVDIASQVVLPSLLGASLPVVFVDYRPLKVHVSNLLSVAGDILHLPFREDSITSLSCLHVAEHIGLGRYGDPIDPSGTLKAAAELARVLAPGGTLLFAVPVGRERVAFNAHRVHEPATICRYFGSLRL
jgi:SAM-dependent methyltransferase